MRVGGEGREFILSESQRKLVLTVLQSSCCAAVQIPIQTPQGGAQISHWNRSFIYKTSSCIQFQDQYSNKMEGYNNLKQIGTISNEGLGQ